MKKIFLIMVCAFYCFVLFAQKNLSGKYYDGAGLCLQIEKDSFRLILSNAARNGFYSEIWAEGSFEPVNESFIKLSSKDIPPIKILKSINIEQEIDSTFNDSINISFLIPYQRGLKITVFTDKFKKFKLDYSENNRSLKIPKDVSSIMFSIRPEYIIPHFSEGLFYGVLEFNSEEYPVEKKANSIKLSIPAMDDSFFEKYYVKGDYARILRDSIIWKGEIFVKEKSSR